MSNWALAAGLGKMATGMAWNTRIGKGAMSGAGLGAAYGLLSDDGSILGGAMRGAASGALIGSAKGGAMAATIGGGIGNMLLGGSFVGGAAAGRLGSAAVSRYGMPGANAVRGMRMGGFGWGASFRRGGQIAYRRARADARMAAQYIGRTARKAVNPIAGIPK